jgi:thiosulfate reductase cytochrome b subunit
MCGVFMMKHMVRVRTAVSILLGICSVLLVISGLGITRPGIIMLLTLGFFDKAAAFRVHLYLWGPFLILLIVHVFYSMLSGKTK